MMNGLERKLIQTDTERVVSILKAFFQMHGKSGKNIDFHLFYFYYKCGGIHFSWLFLTYFIFTYDIIDGSLEGI